MSMNWGQFNTFVSSVLNVGSTLDVVLSSFITDAGRFLEGNYSFLYMERFRAFTQSTGNRYVALTGIPKRIELFREVTADGKYNNFHQEDPEDFDEEDPNALGKPSMFWLDGQGGSTPPQAPRLVLNMAPTADMTCEMIEVIQTDWDTFNSLQTPWLVAYGRQAFLNQILYSIYSTPALYDPERAQVALAIRNSELDVLLNRDDDLRRSLRNEQLRFGRNM